MNHPRLSKNDLLVVLGLHSTSSSPHWVGLGLPTVSVVDEVTARPVGTVASDPVLLAQLGLVLVVPHHVPLQYRQHSRNLILK